jgi:hypothetical protein
LLANESAVKIIPLLQETHLFIKIPVYYLCTDLKRELRCEVAKTFEGFDIAWILNSLEVSKDDKEEALKWLESNAPSL